MELRHLRYFVAVVEEANFARAARRLGISQPPLSRQIQDLEYHVGTALLTRGPRGSVPTEAGQLFYVDAKRILEDAERALARVRRFADGSGGTLRIGFSHAAAGLLVEALQVYRTKYADIHVELLPMFASEQASALERSGIDVAFGYALPPLQKVPNLTRKALFEEQLILALPSAWLDSRNWEEAGELELLTIPLRSAPEYRVRLLDALASVGIEPKSVRDVPALRTVLALVGCGAGFGVVPSSVRRENPPGVRFVEVDWTMTLGLFAFWQRSQPSVDRLLHAIREMGIPSR